jgi:glutaredoxin
MRRVALAPALLSKLLLLLSLSSSAPFALGCRSTPSSGATAMPQASATGTDPLPSLTLTDETPNLLLTWIGEEGDFHVEESIAKVPEARRSQVRVVVTDRADGSGPNVYVADLTVKRPDGTYAVNTLPRSDWEKLGADLRKTRMEALAPNAANGKAAPQATPADAPEQAADSKVTAIVYGADWCKPCHDAERYLKSLGVAVTKKDIEASRAANAEMQEKLVRANRGGSSIPVIDVMGKIFVGYNPGSLKQAVEAARAAASKHG